MRRTVEEHVARLPVAYFDSTKTGVLISRIMSDAEGIRNLVGTGLVQLVGGIVTAAIALGVLFWLNWKLTTATLLLLAAFGVVMALAFSRLRPIFRERGKINAEVTGRLAETLGGIRIVKAYTAEKREALVFTKGAHRLFRNVARTMLGELGGRCGVHGDRRRHRHADDRDRRPRHSRRRDDLGDFFMYIFFTGLVAAPVVSIASIGTQITEAFAGLDRIREIRRDGDRGRRGSDARADRARQRRGRVRAA